MVRPARGEYETTISAELSSGNDLKWPSENEKALFVVMEQINIT